jgi:hypothetical protein
VGLFLVAGTASAQNWVPSTSPYGTWRQPAQASKPVNNSWREAAKPASAPDGSTSNDPVAPLPPTPPAAVEKPSVLPPPVVIEQPAPASPPVVVIEQPAALPPSRSARDAEPLPPLPPPPAPFTTQKTPLVPVRHENEESTQPAALSPQAPVTIKQTDFQPPLGMIDDRRGYEDRALDQTIQLEPPGPDRLFRLESEAALNERMRQEGKTKVPPEKIAFPEEPVVSREAYPGRHWPPQTELAEPNYVCYGRLLFEDKNTERFGWDFGILQPVFSTAKFYADVVTLPYHIATAPCRCYECSSGLCLPGDPVPYLCYPPELSATGALAEVGSIVGVLAIFP